MKTTVDCCSRVCTLPVDHCKPWCVHGVHIVIPPPIREQSIVMSVSVCLSVCLSVHDHIFGTTRPILTKIFVHVTYGRGSVLSRRRSDILCTSGFIDDVMLAHKPRLLSVATQLKRSAHAALGLAINCAGQRTHRTAFRALVVTFQVAAPGVKSAVSDCLVGDCRKCTTCCSSRGSAAFRSACLRSCLLFRSYDQCLH